MGFNANRTTCSEIGSIAIGVALVCCTTGCDQGASNSSATQQKSAATSSSATPAPSAAPASQTTPQDLQNVSDFVKSATKSSEPPLGRAHATPPAVPPIGAKTAQQPLQYVTPETWTSQKPTSPMRQAQYLVPRVGSDSQDAEFIVFYFPTGEGGGVKDNIVRWRRMFTDAQGAPLPDEAVRIEQREVNGLKVVTLDQSGRYTPQMPGGPPGTPQADMRMLGAIVQANGGNWFFRMIGPEATVAANRDAFEQLINSAKQ